MQRVTVIADHKPVLSAQASDTFLTYLPNILCRPAVKSTVVCDPSRQVLLVDLGFTVRNLGGIDLFFMQEICDWLGQPSMRRPRPVDSLSPHSEVAMRLRQNR